MSITKFILLLKKAYLLNYRPYMSLNRKYDLTFLSKDSPDTSTDEIVNKVIYCFWTGKNKMSKNREYGIETIKKNSGVQVILITPDNLNQYILPDYPLHKAYPYLSNVHKADYLRCYFMHHWGGGYSDIKPHFHSWCGAFDDLNNDSYKYCVGYSEIKPQDIGYIDSFVNLEQVKQINLDMKNYYFLLTGNCSYIFKPRTEFTQRWITELHARLDLMYPDLKKKPGNIMGDNEGYPLKWTSILGQIFHPLSLIFMDKVIKNELLRPSLKNYR